MNKINGPNVPDALKFIEKLQHAMKSIFDLLELTKEYDLEAVDKDGARCFYQDEGKTCFQVSGQYERPHEFLQALLDIIRVNYEPSVMGTLLLNANMCFLYDEILEKPFQLGYVSIVSKENEIFDSFWGGSVKPYLKKCGYNIGEATAIYAVITTGDKRYGPELLGEIMTSLNSGFSLDEACELLSSSINSSVSRPRKQIYSGYCLDSAMGSRIRLSLWIFIRNNEHIIQ